MKVEESKKDIRFTQVLPEDLVRKIDEDAALKKRSRIQQIAWILQNHYENQEFPNKQVTFAEA